MRISRVEIENFRSVEQADIQFDNLTALVGRNGAGKSTVLNALSAFYNLASQFTEFDYFDCDMRRQIRIRVTFSDLTNDEKAEFGSYVADEKLEVTKLISIGGSTYRGVRRQIAEFANIRQLAFRPAQVELRALIESAKCPGLQGVPRSQADLNDLLNAYESEHSELSQPTESDTQFLGPVNVGGGKLDKFTRFVRVLAVRDAIGEVERKGAILQLIDVLVLRSVNARPEVIALNEELERRFREIFSRENVTELDLIAADVTSLLQRYAPGTALELDFAEIQAPKVPAPQPLARMLEDKFKCPISHAGHGLQRALIFALLEQLARTEASMERAGESQKSSESTADAGTRPQQSSDLILAIEEPELFLHPPRGRFLAKTLKTLAEQHAGSRTQVCYTTHSPLFVGLDLFDQIRIARKATADGTNTRRTVFFSCSRETATRNLAKIVGGDDAEFTAESFRVHAAPVMTSVVNEGFFGDAAIVVEGVSDAAALTTLQELMGEKWDEKGIVVVPAIGKSNIDRPVIVFKGFGIPTYFVFDGDADASGAEKAQAVVLNHRLLRLAGVAAEDFPASQVQRGWAVFGNDLENELERADPEFFRDERTRIATEYGIKRANQTLKNPETTSLYVRQAHKNGKIPAILVELVKSISALVAI
jgi:predicted ATPase